MSNNILERVFYSCRLFQTVFVGSLVIVLKKLLPQASSVDKYRQTCSEPMALVLWKRCRYRLFKKMIINCTYIFFSGRLLLPKRFSYSSFRNNWMNLMGKIPNYFLLDPEVNRIVNEECSFPLQDWYLITLLWFQISEQYARFAVSTRHKI